MAKSKNSVAPVAAVAPVAVAPVAVAPVAVAPVAPVAVAPVAPVAVAPVAVAVVPVVATVPIDSKAFKPASLAAQWAGILGTLVASQGNQWSIVALCKAECHAYKIDPKMLPVEQLSDLIRTVIDFLNVMGHGPCERYTKDNADDAHPIGSVMLDDGERVPLEANKMSALRGDCKRSLRATPKTKAAPPVVLIDSTTPFDGAISAQVPRDPVDNTPVNVAPVGDGIAAYGAIMGTDANAAKRAYIKTVALKLQGMKHPDAKTVHEFVIEVLALIA